MNAGNNDFRVAGGHGANGKKGNCTGTDPEGLICHTKEFGISVVETLILSMRLP